MIGRTNVGGGTGGTLTVNAPAGVTVVLSTDGVTAKYTKTANGDGVAVFKGVSSGTWYVAIIDGDQFAYKAVTVTTDYATTITFFSATIRITYPAGSGSHVEGPNGYYAQSPDTSGYWEVTVPAAGDYLVCADDSTTGQGANKTVTITEDGESTAVAISYATYLYNSGDECTEITGGWHAVSGTVTKNSDNMVISGVTATINKISTVGYKTIEITCVGSKTELHFGLGSTNNLFSAGQVVLPYEAKETVYLDVTSVQGEYYPIFACPGSSTITAYSVCLIK